jgi:hypothetical protein
MSTVVIAEKDVPGRAALGIAAGALLKGNVEGVSFVLEVRVGGGDPTDVAIALANLIRLGAIYATDTDPRRIARDETVEALKRLQQG